MSNQPSSAAAELRSTQIILIALAAVVGVLALVAAYVGGVLYAFESPRFREYDVLAIVAVCMSLQAIPLSFLLPAKFVKGAVDRDPASRRQAFRGSRIVAGALCEGAALL